MEINSVFCFGVLFVGAIVSMSFSIRMLMSGLGYFCKQDCSENEN